MIPAAPGCLLLKIMREVCAYVADEAPGMGMFAFTQPDKDLTLQLWRPWIGPRSSNPGGKSFVLYQAVNEVLPITSVGFRLTQSY